jgi:serine/threonine protein kinase
MFVFFLAKNKKLITCMQRCCIWLSSQIDRSFGNKTGKQPTMSVLCEHKIDESSMLIDTKEPPLVDVNTIIKQVSPKSGNDMYLPCHCMQLLRLDPSVMNLQLLKQFKANPRQHVHRALLFTIFKTYQVVIKLSYNKREYDMLKHLNTINFKDNERPYVKVLLCHELVLRDGQLCYLLVLEEGGQDLFDYVESYHDNFIPMNKAISIIHSIVTQFTILHDVGIAHLDASLENVLYDAAKNKCLLIDFEFSKILDPHEEFHFNKNKYEGGLFGKRGYMSQEQIGSDPLHGYQIDIFGIGIMAFILIMNFPPFAKHFDATGILFHDGKIRSLVQKFVPESLDRFDSCKHFENFIQTCCGRPTNRPKHARELLSHPFLQPFLQN